MGQIHFGCVVYRKRSEKSLLLQKFLQKSLFLFFFSKSHWRELFSRVHHVGWWKREKLYFHCSVVFKRHFLDYMRCLVNLHQAWEIGWVFLYVVGNKDPDSWTIAISKNHPIPLVWLFDTVQVAFCYLHFCRLYGTLDALLGILIIFFTYHREIILSQSPFGVWLKCSGCAWKINGTNIFDMHRRYPKASVFLVLSSPHNFSFGGWNHTASREEFHLG